MVSGKWWECGIAIYCRLQRKLQERSSTVKICRKENAPRYRRDGITSYLLVAESTVGARSLTTSLVEMEQGGWQRPHSHPVEQSYFIISGEGVMLVGEASQRVTAGETVFIPSGTMHGLVNDGPGVLCYLSAGAPPFGGPDEKKLWPIEPVKPQESCRRKRSGDDDGIAAK